MAVRTFGLRCQDRVGVERCRPLGQREYRQERTGGIERLVREHRQVLGHVVPKRNSEHSHVVRASVPAANYGLWTKLIRDSHPRRKVCERGVHVSIQTTPILPCDQYLGGCQVLEAALVFAIDVLWEVYLPAQT